MKIGLLAALLAAASSAVPAQAESGFFSRCALTGPTGAGAAGPEVAWGGFDGEYRSGGSDFFLVEDDRMYRLQFNDLGRDAVGQIAFVEGLQRTAYLLDGGRITYRISGFEDGELVNRVYEGTCAEVDR